MDKKKYYINIGDGEISQTKVHNNAQYTIYATNEEVEQLRRKFNNMHDASFASYLRSHIPFVPYHNDKPNDDYDQNLEEVFQLLYELGDDKTREHIAELDILPLKFD